MPQTTVIEAQYGLLFEQQKGAEVIWRDIMVANNDTSKVLLRLFDPLWRPLDLSGQEIQMCVSMPTLLFTEDMTINGNEAELVFTISTNGSQVGRWGIRVVDTESGLYWVAAEGSITVRDPQILSWEQGI